MLYVAKVTDRLGKVADGNTVSDFDPEEIKKHGSISASLMNLVWNGKKINILDTPGDFDFVGEVKLFRSPEAPSSLLTVSPV